MVTTNAKSIACSMLMVGTLFIGAPQTQAGEFENSIIESIELAKGNNDLKYGQYVYVTLKDGTQTVGKIAGKKNSKKYYVNQLNGSNHGLVHVKYIRKMTKSEVEQYKSSKGE